MTVRPALGGKHGAHELVVAVNGGAVGDLAKGGRWRPSGLCAALNKDDGRACERDRGTKVGTAVLVEGLRWRSASTNPRIHAGTGLRRGAQCCVGECEAFEDVAAAAVNLHGVVARVQAEEHAQCVGGGVHVSSRVAHGSRRSPEDLSCSKAHRRVGAVFAGLHADHQDSERTLGVAEHVVIADVELARREHPVGGDLGGAADAPWAGCVAWAAESLTVIDLSYQVRLEILANCDRGLGIRPEHRRSVSGQRRESALIVGQEENTRRRAVRWRCSSRYSAAIGGSRDDWPGRGHAIEQERHAVVLVRPIRVYSKRLVPERSLGAHGAKEALVADRHEH